MTVLRKLIHLPIEAAKSNKRRQGTSNSVNQ